MVGIKTKKKKKNVLILIKMSKIDAHEENMNSKNCFNGLILKEK